MTASSIKALVSHAKHTLARAEQLYDMDHGWSSIARYPPPEGVTVLVWRKNVGAALAYRTTGCYHEGRLVDVKYMIGNVEGDPFWFGVTHWCALPEPPPEE
jgi:hypothetical protein